MIQKIIKPVNILFQDNLASPELERGGEIIGNHEQGNINQTQENFENLDGTFLDHYNSLDKVPISHTESDLLQPKIMADLSDEIKRMYQSRRQKTFEDTESDDVQQEPIDTFEELTRPYANMKEYSHMFNELIKQQTVETSHPIVSMMITYDSTRTVLVSKVNDQEYLVQMYDLQTYQIQFQESFKGTYIKLKEVE